MGNFGEGEPSGGRENPGGLGILQGSVEAFRCSVQSQLAWPCWFNQKVRHWISSRAVGSKTKVNFDVCWWMRLLNIEYCLPSMAFSSHHHSGHLPILKLTQVVHVFRFPATHPPSSASPCLTTGVARRKEESFYLHRGQARPSLQLAEDAVRGGDACPKACDMAWCFGGDGDDSERLDRFLGRRKRGKDTRCTMCQHVDAKQWFYMTVLASIWHLLAIKAQKMEPDKAWNVTFPTVYITVLVRFYAGLMVHTPTVSHISLCTRPPYPTCVCPTCFGCSSPVKPIYPLCVAVDLLHSRVFLSALSTLIPLDPSNPLVGDISQDQRWMVSIVMWIPQSLDGLFHGKSISKILWKWIMTGGTPILGNHQAPKNRRFGSWKVKIQDKLWSVPCLILPLNGMIGTVSITLFSP